MDLFAIGEVVKTRGLRGCLKVLSYLETKSIFTELKFVYVEKSTGQKNRYCIKKIDVSGKFLFVELKEIDDAASAQTLVGCKVFLPKDSLQKLPEGEYYWRDIVGLDVLSEEGKHLGRIEYIFPTGSNDVYVCKGGQREILLPAIAEVIKRIDLDRRVMIVKLIKGL